VIADAVIADAVPAPVGKDTSGGGRSALLHLAIMTCFAVRTRREI
jgi:hypothetical protein